MNKYENFYLSENLLAYPRQRAISKYSYPRLFIRFNYEDSYFASYEDFYNSIAVVEWIDGEKPKDPNEVESILTDCWNFLAMHEREEERLADETDFDDDFL